MTKSMMGNCHLINVLVKNAKQIHFTNSKQYIIAVVCGLLSHQTDFSYLGNTQNLWEGCQES